VCHEECFKDLVEINSLLDKIVTAKATMSSVFVEGIILLYKFIGVTLTGFGTLSEFGQKIICTVAFWGI
jgi:hypothetical protein